MNRCEDAPCCGCCGTNLYGNDQSDYYAEPAGLDPYYSDFYDEDPSECSNPEHECNDCDGPNYTTGDPWMCSWCHRPCPIETHDQMPAEW